MDKVAIDRRSFLKEAVLAAVAAAGGWSTTTWASTEGVSHTSSLQGVSVPKMDIPRGSCDCHVHVFDPARFPYALPRTYTPGAATVESLLQFEKKINIERVILVQPSTYGVDNRCLLDSIQRIGMARSRGIAVVDLDSVSRQELATLNNSGVRGIRLNLEVRGEKNPAALRDILMKAQDLIGDLGWMAQIYVDAEVVELLAEDISRLKIPVVLDHFGGIKSDRGMKQPGFSSLLSLISQSNVYVKISAPYRVSKTGPYFPDVADYAMEIVSAAPGKVVWGSDWPHTGSSANRTGDLTKIEPFRSEDAGKTLDLLQVWVPDPKLRHQILVENPGKLYGFNR